MYCDTELSEMTRSATAIKSEIDRLLLAMGTPLASNMTVGHYINNRWRAIAAEMGTVIDIVDAVGGGFVQNAEKQIDTEKC